MADFDRFFYMKSKKPGHQKEAIEKLRSEPMFAYLLEDIREGVVFPAIRRENAIDFYCEGAFLCRYTGMKIQSWHNSMPAPNNKLEYDRIKEACKKWGIKKDGRENERATLSFYYKAFSPYTGKQSRFVLLDIEVGFPRLGESMCDMVQNVQVDLLFLDTENAVLYFVEAKEADDGRIKIIPSSDEADAICEQLEVTKQIEKYNSNLMIREHEIILAYQNYIRVMREIFHVSFGDVDVEGLTLYPKLKLFVYGESNQRYGIVCFHALQKKLKEDLIAKTDPRSLSEDDIAKTGEPCRK